MKIQRFIGNGTPGLYLGKSADCGTSDLTDASLALLKHITRDEDIVKALVSHGYEPGVCYPFFGQSYDKPLHGSSSDASGPSAGSGSRGIDDGEIRSSTTGQCRNKNIDGSKRSSVTKLTHPDSEIKSSTTRQCRNKNIDGRKRSSVLKLTHAASHTGDGKHYPEQDDHTAASHTGDGKHYPEQDDHTAASHTGDGKHYPEQDDHTETSHTGDGKHYPEQDDHTAASHTGDGKHYPGQDDHTAASNTDGTIITPGKDGRNFTPQNVDTCAPSVKDDDNDASDSGEVYVNTFSDDDEYTDTVSDLRGFTNTRADINNHDARADSQSIGVSSNDNEAALSSQVEDGNVNNTAIADKQEISKQISWIKQENQVLDKRSEIIIKLAERENTEDEFGTNPNLDDNKSITGPQESTKTRDSRDTANNAKFNNSTTPNGAPRGSDKQIQYINGVRTEIRYDNPMYPEY